MKRRTLTCIIAMLWKKNKVIDMGKIGGLVPVPLAINDEDQAVGIYTTTAGINRAFLWQDGVATDLGTLPGDNFAEGSAINHKGQVVGQSCAPSGFPNCGVFIWQDGVMTDLNFLVPADSPLQMLEATGINSRGQVVGLALQKATGESRAYLATPCDEENTAEKGCEDQAVSASQGAMRQRPTIVLRENVRKLLRGRTFDGVFRP